MCTSLKHLRMTELAAVLLISIAISPSVVAGDEKCFLPRKGAGENATLFVDPSSKVCQAFERELNADCSGEIPTVEFVPTLPDSGLTLPAWESIQLFNSDGSENANSFGLLEKLIWSRAITGYSVNKKSRAKRDVERILGEVRRAHATNRKPRFDKVTLDLEGRGKKEVLYRLYSGLGQNPMSAEDLYSAYIGGPRLFLERALELANGKDYLKASSSASGGQLTIKSANVLLFDDAPYLLSLGPDVTYVYAAYSRTGRPMIPDEKFEQRTFILPQMRCIFDSRPTH